jgi:multidrug efflux pump subunit AcrA (membrane-fusion protein)
VSRWRTGARVAGVVSLMAVLFAWNEGLFRDRVEGANRSAGETGRFVGPSATVERRRVPATVEVAGGVRARRSASLSSRVPGIVAEVAVEEGARVRAGDVLVRLSAPDLDSRGTAARGAVASARAALEQAERDFRRVAELHERGAATPLERERAQTQLRGARGRLSRALGESKATTTVAGYATLEASRLRACRSSS